MLYTLVLLLHNITIKSLLMDAKYAGRIDPKMVLKALKLKTLSNVRIKQMALMVNMDNIAVECLK